MSDTLISSLYATLSGHAAITALVGQNIFPVQAPQRTPPPYIIFTRISGDAAAHMTGPSNDRESRIQIDIYSRSYAQADELRTEVVDLLHGQTGPLAATDLWVALLEYTDESREDEDEFFRITIDFRVLYSTTPITPESE